MKKALITAVFAVCAAFALVACAPTQEASSTNPASQSATASTAATAAKVKCDLCGAEVEASAIKMVDGKNVCINCAEQHDGNHDANMVDCAGCGMQVAKADAIEKDGKPYCSHCAESMGLTKQESGTTTETPSHEGEGH